jgi:hypothetical protein
MDPTRDLKHRRAEILAQLNGAYLILNRLSAMLLG